MKRVFQILTLPFVWAWKILSSGLSVLVNLLLLAGDERTLVFVRTREDTTA